MSDASTARSGSPERDGTPRGRVLVTGVSGYLGGLLVQPLIDAGWRVRVLTRHADALRDRPWRDTVDIVTGDASREDDLRRALADVDVAYYLLHSMEGGGDFATRDRAMAHRFAEAAAATGVRRIVYLGGLHPDGKLSEHLASRVEVGEIFLRGRVPAACLQAAVILGDGSASFDMLRHLTERLPAMVAPQWLDNRIQPIAVDDAVRYLVGAADLPDDVNRTFDIGGPEVLTYTGMIERFAQVTGLRRRPVQTLPVLTPGLASHWVGLVTPVSAQVAKPLVGSLVHEVVCREHDIAQYVPDPDGGLVGFDEAVRRAMRDASPSPGPRNLALTSAAVVACALVGSVATDPDSGWYRSLDKPAWQPPKVAFPVVWTALYAALAGVSASAMTNLDDKGESGKATAYRAALATNLLLNAGWSATFFRARNLPAATVVAAALAASSADLARRAGDASKTHAAGLTPYALWCGFATLLSAALARRNR